MSAIQGRPKASMKRKDVNVSEASDEVVNWMFKAKRINLF